MAADDLLIPAGMAAIAAPALDSAPPGLAEPLGWRRAAVDAALSLTGVLFADDLWELWARTPPILRDSPLAGYARSRMRRHLPRRARDRGIVFIHVPKTGGTSMAQAIYGRGAGHATALFWRAADPKVFIAAESFAMLRDPIDRFVSAYRYIRNAAEVPLNQRAREFAARMRTADDVISVLEGSSDWAVPKVFRPQHLFVCDAAGRQMVSRLFLVGEDDENLRQHLDRYGVAEPQRLNRSRGRRPQLTRRQIARLEMLFAKDFSLIDRRVS
ncbi:MAG TPA: sulfotransferase family 2 domain-containing protein [Caulobacteraceae bacterium]|nr:sulfotransferase family 2 domain-containing protein [Caulobacteraceae bacterium]